MRRGSRCCWSWRGASACFGPLPAGSPVRLFFFGTEEPPIFRSRDMRELIAALERAVLELRTRPDPGD